MNWGKMWPEFSALVLAIIGFIIAITTITSKFMMFILMSVSRILPKERFPMFYL